MKRNKFSEAQIIKVLKEAEAGRSVSDLCREHSIHESTFITGRKSTGACRCRWMMQRLRQLEEENRKLKVDLSLQLIGP